MKIKRPPSTKNLDHALAIRQTVLDVITQHRLTTNKPLYFAKGLYLIDIRPEITFDNRLIEPVIIYKTNQLGEDRVRHFEKYKYSFEVTEEDDLNILFSINPYKEKENGTEVVADWLFVIRGQYLHFEIDCGNEQLTKPKSEHANDSSFEGKLTRLQPELEKKKINPTNYHVFFIMVDNREDAVLTQIHPTRIRRIANAKQEIARFEGFMKTLFNTYMIRFSRSEKFLENFFYKMRYIQDDESTISQHIIHELKTRKDLQVDDWKCLIIGKEQYKNYNFSPSGNYNAEPFLICYEHSTNAPQYIVPFFAIEGDIQNAEQLAILSNDVHTNKYGSGTKILVLYPTDDELFKDVIRKNKATSSKDSFAMDTSRILFSSVESFLYPHDETMFLNESKKPKKFTDFFKVN